MERKGGGGGSAREAGTVSFGTIARLRLETFPVLDFGRQKNSLTTPLRRTVDDA